MSLNETEALAFVLIICVQCFQKQPLQIIFSPFVLYDGIYSSVYMINDFTHVAIYIHVQYSPCVCVLRFYGPVNPVGSCRARSVYLTTRLLGRHSPQYCANSFARNWQLPFLKYNIRPNYCPVRFIFMYNIRPNYCPVRLGFSEILEKLVVRYSPNKTLFNSFGAKFQTTFAVCFSFFNKLSLEKKFIRKVERLNVKQHRSRWDGSYEPSHLDLCCLQKPIIIACDSERVKRSAEDSMGSVFNEAFEILISDFLYKIICSGYSFELPRLIKAYVVGTRLNCLDKSRQFKWVPFTYDFIKK